jgi:tripartite ATP-independent transporter DctP family solute receptor
MKRTFCCVTAVLAAVFFLSVSTQVKPASAQKKFNMKCALSTLNDVQVEWAKRFSERVVKRSGGRITAKVYPGAQLGNVMRLIEGVQLGTVECWMAPPAFLVGVDPRFQVLAAPGLFNDFDHAERALSEPKFRKTFLGLGEKKGMKGVSLVVFGPTTFGTRKPVKKLADFKGKKIRVFASPMQTIPIKMLGASPSPMPLMEVLPALQRGAIDGVRTAVSIFTTFKYYDIIKDITLTNDAWITSIGMVSKIWYDKLPPDLQKIVVEEGSAVQPELFKWGKQFIADAQKTWTDNGGVFNKLPPDQKAKMMKDFSKVGPEVVKNKPGVKKVYDILLEAVKKTAK